MPPGCQAATPGIRFLDVSSLNMSETVRSVLVPPCKKYWWSVAVALQASGTGQILDPGLRGGGALPMGGFGAGSWGVRVVGEVRERLLCRGSSHTSEWRASLAQRKLEVKEGREGGQRGQAHTGLCSPLIAGGGLPLPQTRMSPLGDTSPHAQHCSSHTGGLVQKLFLP